MNLHLDRRSANEFAFYMDGDLQFDTQDEALYHEGLALPALSLAAQQKPEADLRVLICGGGDGLALREALRFPRVAHVDLVDYSSEVVEWGRTCFADLNAQAFADLRAHVHIADAWEFLHTRHANEAAPYDVVLCDFTVPRREEDTRIYSMEWYQLLRRALGENGLLALNTLSPEVTPEAFWCLQQTLRAARLNPQPYRVCLPSFRAQGYGLWAFALAGPRLRRRDLANIACPVPTRQYSFAGLWPSAQFPSWERRLARSLRPHTLQTPRLLPLLLNPGLPVLNKPARPDVGASGVTVGASDPRSTAETRLETLPVSTGADTPYSTGADTPYDLNALLAAIPISHPYHTRVMIESLAEQVVGSVRKLDVQQLVSALLKRAQQLPLALQTELTRLQDFLHNRLPRLELLGAWGRKLFVILVILMTLANAVAPDNAFGKGTGSFGHASMSRGYGGSFGRGESGFGSSGGRTTGSSFGGKPGYGSSFGSSPGRASSGSFGSPAPVIRSSGFRSSYGTGRPTDIEGVPYQTRSFTYIPHSHTTVYVGHSDTYYGDGGNEFNAPAPGNRQEHKALFVADDDMLVLDNGDVVITLSEEAYLLVSGSVVSLMSTKSPNALLNLYPDPVLFNNILTQLQDQQAQVTAAIKPRRDWLEWVGWTSAFAGAVGEDKTELHNLEDLQRRLDAAMKQIHPPSANAAPAPPPEANGVELFVDALLLQNGQTAIRTADNTWLSTNGKKLFLPGKGSADCPPEMQAVLKSVLTKLQQEFKGDLVSAENDLKELAQEKATLDKDLAEYNSLYAANGNDPSYQVDYGTDEIRVADAISRTQSDLSENLNTTSQTLAERDKQTGDLQRIEQALQAMTP